MARQIAHPVAVPTVRRNALKGSVERVSVQSYMA
jgi:hypothetical protein